MTLMCDEPDFYADMVEDLVTLEETMMNVESYDDYFVDVQ